MRVMVISAHPDDIEPQMGGTIAEYTSKGHEVLIFTLTIPHQDKFGQNIEEAKKERIEEAEKSANILGAKLILLDLDQYEIGGQQRKLVQIIEKYIKNFSPEIIYTCWDKGSHQDHKLVSNAVISATRKNDITLYFFEPIIPEGLVPYSFLADTYVIIDNVINKKIESIKCYQSQMRKYSDDWVNSIIARNKFTGFRFREIKANYIESFMTVRRIKHIRQNS